MYDDRFLVKLKYDRIKIKRNVDKPYEGFYYFFGADYYKGKSVKYLRNE